MTVVIKNIFDAIAGTPEEAEDLKLRNALMTLVKSELDRQTLKGAKARARLQLDQEAFKHFKQGAISEFSVGHLALMLRMLGRRVVVGLDPISEHAVDDDDYDPRMATIYASLATLKASRPSPEQETRLDEIARLLQEAVAKMEERE